MKRSTNISRNQLALYLEPQRRPSLEGEAREALIMALADLLLEAYGTEDVEETGEQGGCHES